MEDVGLLAYRRDQVLIEKYGSTRTGGGEKRGMHMSTNMECPGCTRPFDLDETRARFNHYYADSSGWDYDRDVTEPMCLGCADDDVEIRWMDGELKAADGDPPEDALKVWRRQRR